MVPSRIRSRPSARLAALTSHGLTVTAAQSCSTASATAASSSASDALARVSRCSSRAARRPMAVKVRRSSLWAKVGGLGGHCPRIADCSSGSVVHPLRGFALAVLAVRGGTRLRLPPAGQLQQPLPGVLRRVVQDGLQQPPQQLADLRSRRRLPTPRPGRSRRSPAGPAPAASVASTAATRCAQLGHPAGRPARATPLAALSAARSANRSSSRSAPTRRTNRRTAASVQSEV